MQLSCCGCTAVVQNPDTVFSKFLKDFAKWSPNAVGDFAPLLAKNQ
jgi:hypothetical protein